MKKILYVITKSNWGGAQRYVYDLATNLPKDEFDVSVAFGGAGKLKTELAVKGIRTIQIPRLERDVSFFKDFKVFFDLIRLFQKERPNIVHLNSSKIAGLGALAGRIARVPKIIFTVHGFAFNEKRPEYELLAIKCVSWLSVILAHQTITIAQAEYDTARNWPLSNGKVALIHNGIISPSFYDRKVAQMKILQAAKKPEDFLKGKKVIGTIAELTENKGIMYAIRAVRKIPDYLYFVIGGGEKEIELKKLISDLHLEDKVFLTGFIADAPHLLKAFDIFLLPSIKEGLPYVLLEAGLAGLPTIATNVGGIPEIIENEKNGLLVRPRQEKEIEMSLRFILENDSKQELGKKLREKIKEKFSLERMVKETKELYLREKTRKEITPPQTHSS